MKRRAVGQVIPTVGGGAMVAVRTVGSRRPVDKQLIRISKNNVGSSQVSTTLATVTFPCTIVGLRWDLGIVSDAGTAVSSASWIIAKVPDGETINNMATGDGNEFFTPEQHVMAFGCTSLAPSDQGAPVVRFEGSTKTMRKMMGGDVLQFAVIGEATNTCSVDGVIQFFCKT